MHTHALQILSVNVEPALLDLPWELPLREWPDEFIAALPRGISRHVVRFVHLSGKIIAIKEIGETSAHHEYETLRDLNRKGASCVEPLAVISNRYDANGKELTAVLVTRHLPYSLPYRAVFGQSGMRQDTINRLTDALSVLMVKLHLLGFYWGDVSLSNTLFRRDAEEFAAYLVDAETGEIHENLSAKKREYDIDVARTNIIGELLDLQAGGILDEDFDAIHIGNRFLERYMMLWNELTEEESFDATERWRVENRIRRLNELGFDVGELNIEADSEGARISIQPKVVDSGHFARKVMRLTGLDVEEAQARRIINDIEQFRTLTGQKNTTLEIVAHQWISDVYQPTIQAIPRELRGKLEPAQIFHEVLDHRWYIGENVGHDVLMRDAVKSYIENVLKHRPDEKTLIERTELENADFTDEDWSGYLA